MDGLRFRLRLTNIGTKDVIVADPRILWAVSPVQRAFIQVASQPAQVRGTMEMPPIWESLALEPAPRDVPDGGLTIRPGESLAVLSAPWRPRAPGAFLAQAVWQDYVGPTRIDPSEIQSAVPKDPGPSDKALVVRGAAFSSYLYFNIPKK